MSAGSEQARHGVFVTTVVAAGLHLAVDAVASRFLFTTPPYLLLDYAAEAFRDLVMLDRTTILVAVAVISAGVNGAIAGLFATALAGARRRVVKTGVALSALWAFSGGLMIAVYLSPPAGAVVGSLLAGVPRAFLIAGVLDRFLPVPAPEATEPEPARGSPPEPPRAA